MEDEVTRVLAPGFPMRVGVEVQKPTLRVVKVQVLAHMNLINEHGEIIAETSAQPINLFPGKFHQLHKLVAKIEEEANKKTDDIQKLVEQVLF